MKLNCDLGESFGSWKMGLDEQVMPHIDMANIACGFHAGDPSTMMKTLMLAKQHGLAVGAHPSYPDLVGFGRRSMQCSEQEIEDFVLYQIAAIDGMAQSIELSIDYVKPHGALYNDMMRQESTRKAIYKALAKYHRPLKLMVLATADSEYLTNEASSYGISLLFEAFADRRYTDEGLLTPRSQSGAVLDKVAMLAQVEQLVKDGSVTSDSGKTIHIQADTVCVHGDNEQAIAIVKEIKALCG
ncbi:5-oxoprolinase subunit PxpA [Thalassotalea agarivorans]|uniref:UPF0271 protein n=1 Tax=Thalassotalea agarivorans TaxID=349064 RepID=A0A1I0CXS7_THASX|nr:5-oxoprolinase subunit PxpA [Thalassotalea agarivorans]SET24684.1 UPF0271 protein [Thalassotalea agarivorans]